MSQINPLAKVKLNKCSQKKMKRIVGNSAAIFFDEPQVATSSFSESKTWRTQERGHIIHYKNTNTSYKCYTKSHWLASVII